jgi:hypothetical protein
VLGLSGEQVESVGQQMQHGAEGGGSAGRAAWKVEDECVVAVVRENAADAAAKGGEGSVAQAVLPDDFGNAGDEAVADGEGGLGSDVAGAKAGAASGDEQAGARCSGAERRDEAVEIVGDDAEIEDAHPGLGEDGRDGWAGEIDLVAGGAAVAGRDYDGSAAGKRAGEIPVQVHAVQNRCTSAGERARLGKGGDKRRTMGARAGEDARRGEKIVQRLRNM